MLPVDGHNDEIYDTKGGERGEMIMIKCQEQLTGLELYVSLYVHL